MEEQQSTKDGAATHRLLVLRAGGRAFAVRAEEAEGVAEGAEPVPLPQAPAAVLGVVCVRGRMYTLLDTAALFPRQASKANAPAHEAASAESRTAAPRFAVALRGDEQLALAADEIAGPLELEDDGASVQLLDPSRLFDAAMRGTERRRQRT
ncbi:MAG TPA: chemotaxis protein CheW [Pyrinomonadaceae bacterium]|nr:chemotaxis protein CheW [Pyrinomonadaceae bacterium]